MNPPTQTEKLSLNRRFLILVVTLLLIVAFRSLTLSTKTDIDSTIIYSSDTGKEVNFFPQVRARLDETINQLYPPLEGQLAKGMILGNDEFDRDFREALINTGTIHVVVVSGFNVSLVAGALLGTKRFLGRRAALGLALVGIVIYTLLTGAEPPTVRAAVMGSLAFAASALGREKESKELLILAGLVMLVADPSLIVEISFQLSILATYGIIEFAPKLVKKLTKFGPFKSDLANTLAAQILVTPIIFFNFGQVSLISPLVNLLVLWTVPIATILGFISLISGVIFLPLGQLLAWFNYLFLGIFSLVVNLFRDVPTLSLPEGSQLLVLGYYLMLFGFLRVKASPSSSKKAVDG